ncbi:MAG: biotin transporter BioY [Candidatus Omnitrophota bacterium]
MLDIALGKEIIVNKVICRIIAVTVFVVLTAIGAFVRIPLPFTPVPLTLQTFFVLLSGAFLGANLGASAQAIYVILGLAGVPVFNSGGFGLTHLMGPTTGYLLGFILSALFVGRFIKYSKDNILAALGIFILADFILLFCGTLWLKIILGYPFMRLLKMGFFPFILPDIFKAFLAALLYLKLKTRLKAIF